MTNSYDDIFIYVPDFRQIVRIAEGTGDNLLYEDRKVGYVDYIYYEQHELSIDLPEVDGGQVMLTELLRDQFKSMLECIPKVLDMAYGDADLEYMLL
jgi:hypothetical protein